MCRVLGVKQPEIDSLWEGTEMKSKSKIFAIIGAVMLVIAIVYFFYAVNHPTLNLPWSLKTIWMIYKTYLSVMASAFLIAIVLKVVEIIKNKMH